MALGPGSGNQLGTSRQCYPAFLVHATFPTQQECLDIDHRATDWGGIYRKTKFSFDIGKTVFSRNIRRCDARV